MSVLILYFSSSVPAFCVGIYSLKLAIHVRLALMGYPIFKLEIRENFGRKEGIGKGVMNSHFSFELLPW